MVLTGDIASTLDNLKMAATADQIHLDHPIATISQMTDTNTILVDQIKQCADTNAILDRKGKEEEKTETKMKVTAQNWI